MSRWPPTGPVHRNADPGDGGRSRSERLALVPMDDYHPGATVRVLGRLPVPLTVALLRLPNGETVPVLPRPDEYVGYLVRGTSGAEQVVAATHVFVRDSLDADARYEFLADANVFSEQLKLFRATVRPADGDSGTGDSGAGDDSGARRGASSVRGDGG